MHAVALKETADTAVFRILGGPAPATAAVVRASILKLFSATADAVRRKDIDPMFSKADAAFRDRAPIFSGLRVIHGDIFETVVSFLVSLRVSRPLLSLTTRVPDPPAAG